MKLWLISCFDDNLFLLIMCDGNYISLTDLFGAKVVNYFEMCK